MNKELKEQTHKEFDKRFYDNGTPSGLNQTYKTFRHLVDAIRDDFIDSLIDKTVQMTEERIVGVIEKKIKHKDTTTGQHYWSQRIRNEAFEHLISLITNKSNINK